MMDVKDSEELKPPPLTVDKAEPEEQPTAAIAKDPDALHSGGGIRC